MRVGAVSLLVAILTWGASHAAPTAARPDVPPLQVPGADLPSVDVRHYAMSGQVRPLLFWVGRDDIGLARVTWRAGRDGVRGYELLLGTDPSRAPRSLNRWGFVAEERGPDGGSVLAMMTGSPDTSYDEETSAAGQRDVVLHGVRNELSAGRAASQLMRVRTTDVLTVYDVDRALLRLARDPSTPRPVDATVSPDTRPGLLVALAELIERGAGRPLDEHEHRQMLREPVRYVFGRSTYELRFRGSRRQAIELNGHLTPAVSASFEIRTLATDARTKFDIAFGTDGYLRGVPIAAAWQPRWWLKVRLALTDEGPDLPRVRAAR